MIVQKSMYEYIEISNGKIAVGADELWYAIGKKRTVHLGKKLERKSTVGNFRRCDSRVD